MARIQFDELDNERGWLRLSTEIAHIIVRAAGFILMFVGLWIGLKVINEAWDLYQKPQGIERIAQAIEKGSNLDKALSSTSSAANSAGDAAGTTRENAARRVKEVNDALGFRLSYFVAWVIAILLLMLVGRLAIAAIKTGGELALYDTQIKRFAKHLAQQASGHRGE